VAIVVADKVLCVEDWVAVVVDMSTVGVDARGGKSLSLKMRSKGHGLHVFRGQLAAVVGGLAITYAILWQSFAVEAVKAAAKMGLSRWCRVRCCKVVTSILSAMC